MWTHTVVVEEKGEKEYFLFRSRDEAQDYVKKLRDERHRINLLLINTIGHEKARLIDHAEVTWWIGDARPRHLKEQEEEDKAFEELESEILELLKGIQ